MTDATDLSRTLQSLACGHLQTRILTKHPKGKEVSETDTFTFNEEFTNERVRVKVGMIAVGETVSRMRDGFDEHES